MRVIEKPWGKEEVLEINDRYLMKKLTMHKGHRCSLQYHNVKKETIYVLSGQLKIIVGPTKETLAEKIYQAHESITICPRRYIGWKRWKIASIWKHPRQIWMMWCGLVMTIKGLLNELQGVHSGSGIGN